MIDACRRHRVKLMIAYRLHFEEINLRAVDLVRRGRIGEPKYFNSSFSMTVRRGDIRTKREYGGGTLYDIGVYCINAARYLFRAEPTGGHGHLGQQRRRHAWRRSTSRPPPSCDSSGGRVASFVTSFNAADVAAYRIVGTKGQLHVDPAYEYAEGLAYTLTVNGKTTRKRIGKRDQFAPELLHFSDCIQRRPRAGALGRGRAAGRPHRAGAVRIGGDGQGRADSAVPRRQAADRPAGDQPARREEAAAGEGAERERGLALSICRSSHAFSNAAPVAVLSKITQASVPVACDSSRRARASR